MANSIYNPYQIRQNEIIFTEDKSFIYSMYPCIFLDNSSEKLIIDKAVITINSDTSQSQYFTSQ